MRKKNVNQSNEVFLCPLREAGWESARKLKVLFEAANNRADNEPLDMEPLREARRQAEKSLEILLRVAAR